ncbi:MAG: hypothetical protein HPY76_02790 [Anaerolineae bacterium]|nr:hypothetical protein [Anaerolineae bacterium]
MLLLLLAGCLPLPRPTLTADLPSATWLPTGTSVPLPSATPSRTPAPTQTGTPTVTATWAVLRGEVLQRANCRYGAGAVYLYKYGLVPGSNLEIIGRNDAGTWLEVRAIGGNNPCWVKADLMAPNGEIMSVAPVDPDDFNLPRSPYYAPPAVLSTVREGDAVTVTFTGIVLRPGDDSLQTPYVVEAWVCRDGQILFEALGSDMNAITFIDEPGCAEPSHARLTAAEKHGYTAFVPIPLP